MTWTKDSLLPTALMGVSGEKGLTFLGPISLLGSDSASSHVRQLWLRSPAQ